MIFERGTAYSLKYDSGNFDYETVRDRIILDTKMMKRLGFSCDWKDEFKFEGRKRTISADPEGYFMLNGTAKTAFRGSLWKPYSIVIYVQSKKVRIRGNIMVHGSEVEEVIEDFERLEQETGLHVSVDAELIG